MYSVSDAFIEQIKAINREFDLKLCFTHPTEQELTGTTIQSMSVDEVVNSTDALTLGCACSNKITVKLINPSMDGDNPLKAIDFKNAVFIAKVGLKVGTDYEYVPLGKFYVTGVETKNDFESVTITAFDGFCKLSEKYVPDVEGTTSIFDKKISLWNVYMDLLLQISEKYDIQTQRVLEEVDMPREEFTLPVVDITYQQALGYVAGCIGCFVRFDREGYIELVPYTETGYGIDRNMQYMNGFTISSGNFPNKVYKPLKVGSLTTGTQNNVIVCGNGADGIVISFENPYITQDMANAVFEMYNGLEYTPCNIKWRGNPAIQAGDIVQATDKNGISHNVLVMSQQIKIGGGLNSTIDCKGKGETASNFSSNFETTGQKLERIYNTLEQAIIDSTKAITGNSGGYVIIRDENGDGEPDEILIMDTNDTTTAKNVWRWNNSGLGFSADGIDGPYGTAITANGQIVADYMTTGLLRADLVAIGDGNGVQIRMQDGVIHFYDVNNKSRLRLGYVNGTYKLAFYNDAGAEIAYFSNNSFEIQNITNGKVRIQDFGFVPRESGNLSFGKLV